MALPIPKFPVPVDPIERQAFIRRRSRLADRFNRMFADGNEKCFCLTVSGIEHEYGRFLWNAAMAPYRED